LKVDIDLPLPTWQHSRS